MTTTSPARHSTDAKSAGKHRRPIQLQTYAIVTRAVEEGVQRGIWRYLKYVDSARIRTDMDPVAEHIEREVLNALCEVIRFDDEESG